MQTQHLAAPDRATHHASSFTIWRDACAPFRSNAGLTQCLCGAYERDCAQPLRLQRDVLARDVSPSPASAVSTVCFRLGRPSTACLATRREAQPRCVLTDFCFPQCFDYEHSRLIGSQHLSEAFASPLSHALARRPTRLGNQAFHDAQFALAGRPGWRAASFFRVLPGEPSL